MNIFIHLLRQEIPKSWKTLAGGWRACQQVGPEARHAERGWRPRQRRPRKLGAWVVGGSGPRAAARRARRPAPGLPHRPPPLPPLWLEGAQLSTDGNPESLQLRLHLYRGRWCLGIETGPEEFPVKEHYFALGSLGTACYCNSVLQAFYFYRPWGEGRGVIA
jgi:hypothetical protein